MKIHKLSQNRTGVFSAGFTLLETVIAVFVGAVMISALYASFACGFATIRVNREELRATQIMVSRIESMRLCNFSQVTNPTNNPPTFTEYFDPNDKESGGGGVAYSGTTTVKVPVSGTFPEAYRTNLLSARVEVTWNTGNIKHTRSMQSYIAREGLQSYISVGK